MQSKRSTANSIVAIHGVGDATHGQIIQFLSKRLSASFKGFAHERSAKMIDGVEYPLAKSDSCEDIYEVYWADIDRPKANLVSVVPRLFRLLWAMLWIGDHCRRFSSR